MTPAHVGSDQSPRLVGVVHPELLVGQVVAAALDAAPGLSCPHVAAEVRRLSTCLPALAVLVVGQRCLEQARDLPRMGSGPVLVVLGEDASADPSGDCLRALRAGALAWLPAQAAQGDLVEAVTAADGGRLWLPGPLAPIVVAALLEAERQGERLRALTAKEHEVLRHLVAGHSAARTAELMLVSTNTVRSHRTRLFAKLGVHAGPEAAAVARGAGLTT